MYTALVRSLVFLHESGGIVPRGSRALVFNQIFLIFLVLGTAVCVVVVGYMLYNAYRYRDGGTEAADLDHPVPGEIPEDRGGGRKLFVSFFFSTVIVVSLVAWTYLTLLYVEAGPAESDDALDVKVEGYRFGWEFTYPNGRTTEELVVPAGRPVELHVVSRDVFHTFGVPGLRVKTDAIPGQVTDTWFTADEPGAYRAQCYELCGEGHSYMTAPVRVVEPGTFEAWYRNDTASANASNGTGNATATGIVTTPTANATAAIAEPVAVTVARTDAASARAPTGGHHG